MSENKAASRYAKSIIDLSKEQNTFEEVKNDMVLLAKIIDQNSELGSILKNPIIPLGKKVGILKDVFATKVQPLTSTFMNLLVMKGRSSILYGISKAFIEQYNVIKGIVIAEVSSATELTDENIKEIEAIVKKETNANEVLIKTKISEKLIGGFVLKVGDKQFDASILYGFNKLKKEFAQGIV